MLEIRKLDRIRLPCLRKVEKGKLFTEVKKVNELLSKVKSKDVTENNKKRGEETALVDKKTGETKCIVKG